jgi:hypothetical protein
VRYLLVVRDARVTSPMTQSLARACGAGLWTHEPRAPSALGLSGAVDQERIWEQSGRRDHGGTPPHSPQTSCWFVDADSVSTRTSCIAQQVGHLNALVPVDGMRHLDRTNDGEIKPLDTRKSAFSDQQRSGAGYK